MTIYSETTLADFKFWDYASRISGLLTCSELARIETELAELHPNGINATDLNDLFSFDPDYVLGLIGETEDSILAREE